MMLYQGWQNTVLKTLFHVMVFFSCEVWAHIINLVVQSDLKAITKGIEKSVPEHGYPDPYPNPSDA